MDTEAYSQSRAPQLLRWQPHDFWRRMAGEANNAVSAHTQVRTSEAPRLLRFFETPYPHVYITSPPSPKTDTLGHDWRTLFLLERTLCGHPLVGLLWERKLEDATQRNIPTTACLHVHRQSQLFLVRVRERQHIVCEKENLRPMWETLRQDIDVEDPTPVLNHV